MKTNFQEWCNFYSPVLLPYYHSFCCLFPEEEEPSFQNFMIHCFRNTRQTYDNTKRMSKAPIYYSS